METFKLPPPDRQGDTSLEETIARRRSIRHFSAAPVTLPQLSQVLWAAQGITDNTPMAYRAIPSAGATYPLEIVVACGQKTIDDIDAGIYHYNMESHSLTRHHQGDVRLELAGAALNQDCIYEAPADIIICAVYSWTLRRYGERGERYVHIEVGHAGQNVYLQATALGMATVAIGAFHDETVKEILRLDKQYQPLYIMPLGKPVSS
jgi:SagB-type dehydrogenase family enzyme